MSILHKVHSKVYQLKLEKLDGRHKGYGPFKYRIWVNGPASDRIWNFTDLREWCWQVWGSSCERDIYMFGYYNQDQKIQNEHWAWHYDRDARSGNLFIYLTNDEALSFFKLKWM